MGQVTVARAFAAVLERMGTEYVFGVNGHGNWAMLDAVVHETGIRGIPARAEDQALQMADGYWRMRRQAPLPIVMTSVGPGNMNILSALATAFYESVALVVLAGSGSTHWFDRGGIEEAYRYAPEEWIQVLRPVCKKAVLVNRPDTAVDMLLRAYQTALSGRPGPVVLQVPFDIQHTPIDDRLPDPRPWMTPHPPAPDPAGVEAATALLAHAERPLVVVGSGVHNARAWAWLGPAGRVSTRAATSSSRSPRPTRTNYSATRTSSRSRRSPSRCSPTPRYRPSSGRRSRRPRRRSSARSSPPRR